MTLRVGLVVATEHSAGGEQYLLRLYGGLAADGRVEGHLLGRLPGWGELDLASSDVGLGPKWSLGRLGRSIISIPREYRIALAAIRSEHEARPFDAFHLQYKREQVLLTRALSKLAPVVWTEHGALPTGAKGRLLGAAYRFAGQPVGQVVAVSVDAATSVREALTSDTVVSTIPTAVDTARFHPPADDEQRRAARAALGVEHEGLLAVVVSRLHELKRIERAIDACRSRAGDRLLIAGTGPHRDELERASEGRAVDFLGWIDDPAPLYRACDLAFMPFTQVEGFPTSLVEAAASGCALVGFAGDPLNDEIRAAGGVILDDGATLDELDRSELSAMQHAALEWSAAYRLGPWLDAHAEVFANAVAERS